MQHLQGSAESRSSITRCCKKLKADPDYQITELEEERLWFDGRTDEDLPPITPIYERFGRLYTAGIYATCIMDRFIG